MRSVKFFSQLARPNAQSPRFEGNLRLRGSHQAPSYQVTASVENLRLLNDNLGELASDFWVSIIGAQGPQWMRLPDFLRQMERA